MQSGRLRLLFAAQPNLFAAPYGHVRRPTPIVLHCLGALLLQYTYMYAIPGAVILAAIAATSVIGDDVISKDGFVQVRAAGWLGGLGWRV